MMDNFSNFSLEQYVLNELSAEETQKMKHALKNSPTLRHRLEEIQVSNMTIKANFDEAVILNNIQRRIESNSTQTKINEPKPNEFKLHTWGKLAYAMPIIAVITVSSIMFNQSTVSPTTASLSFEEDDIRLKGLQPHINIYQQVAGGAKKLENFATLQQNDSLQLSYIAAGERYGIIFSIDGRGTLTSHFPNDKHQSTDLNASGEFMMAQSYLLDDAPKFENFYFISSKQPFDSRTIIQLAENSISSIDQTSRIIPNLPKMLKQHVLTIKKVKQ